MTTTTDMQKKPHHGHNIKRIREMLEVKQETLARELGDDWSQKKISFLENKEEVDAELLERVAKALKVPVEAIQNFSEEAAIFNIQHNHEGSNPNANNVGASAQMNYQCTFNPIDKMVELYDDKMKLYEALLKEKDEKIALLERLLGEKK